MSINISIKKYRCMNRLIIKYSLFWTVLTIIASGLTWLIVSFMPDSGWLYWTSIVLLIIEWLLYLVLCIILLVAYFIEAHKTEINEYFRNIGNGLLSIFKEAWSKAGEMYGNLFWFGRFR